MKIKTILFDLDDTLIVDACNYNTPELVCSLLIMQDLGRMAPRAFHILARQKTMLEELILQAGFYESVFPQSFLKTYYNYCEELNIKPNTKIAGAIVEAAAKYFVEKYFLYPEAEQVLTRLKRDGYDLQIFTLGAPTIQNYKIDSVGLRPYFNKINIVEKKTTSRLKQYLDENPNTKSNSILYVGNSYNHDVLPALENKIKIAHLYRHESRYVYHHDKLIAQEHLQTDSKKYFPIASLHEVIDLVENKYIPKMDLIHG